MVGRYILLWLLIGLIFNKQAKLSVSGFLKSDTNVFVNFPVVKIRPTMSCIKKQCKRLAIHHLVKLRFPFTYLQFGWASISTIGMLHSEWKVSWLRPLSPCIMDACHPTMNIRATSGLYRMSQQWLGTFQQGSTCLQFVVTDLALLAWQQAYVLVIWSLFYYDLMHVIIKFKFICLTGKTSKSTNARIKHI